ncbi:DUF2200 family protein [uncultured Pseudokineococcus sp.]|uniref:DUF2200 family protein n=1 Tax=uncultured Pseudokineococcus sp. TaxID=1642928 RepID=UPI003443EE42
MCPRRRGRTPQLRRAVRECPPARRRRGRDRGRRRDNVDAVAGWLTGYDTAGLEQALTSEIDLEMSSRRRRR